MRIKRYISIYIIVAVIFSIAPFAHAQELSASEFSISIGSANLAKDLSFLAFEGRVQIGFPAGTFKAPALVDLQEIPGPVVAPSGFSPASVAYQIDIPSETFTAGKEFFLSLKSSGSSMYKQIHFFDPLTQSWKPWTTSENFGKGILSTKLTIPSTRLAVFESKTVLVKGKASWYRYKNGLFAASPDFPKGTRLRVINTANKKSVDVVVNDYGPVRTTHPDRVVDLDAVAFARLAPLGQGTITVAVEELTGTAPVVAPTPAPILPKKPTELSISARSGAVLNSADKKIIWTKDENAVVPLASLSKLVAVKVFLETKPNLKKVVSYSVKDEQLNALYVPLSVSARLKLKDKDQVTIKDLLYSSLIGSTNNTVESLVRLSGISRETFIARMNKRVKDWGAKKTKFVEPTGLSTKNVTTAKEYVIIAREVFLDPIISQASSLPSYSLTTINTKIKHSFQNTNLLARNAKSGLLGSKTGYLEEAGNCLVTKWPTVKNKNIIVILFGEPTRQASIDDTKALVSYATDTLK